VYLSLPSPSFFSHCHGSLSWVVDERYLSDIPPWISFSRECNFFPERRNYLFLSFFSAGSSFLVPFLRRKSDHPSLRSPAFYFSHSLYEFLFRRSSVIFCLNSSGAFQPIVHSAAHPNVSSTFKFSGTPFLVSHFFLRVPLSPCP